MNIKKGLFTATSLIIFIVAPQFSFAADFAKYKQFYASSTGANFLPNGTLIKTAKSNTVYYVKDGKKSMILPQITSLWFKEAHYFKIDCVVTVSKEDFDRYAQTKSVNPYYIGKILKGPDGVQYFIDNKLQKRKISSAVRAALRYPSRNLYPTSAAHLKEFANGPEITRTDVHPGGTVMYNGAYHGGTVWRVEEKDGKYIKHYYLQDYIYETEGYPWSGQIVSVSTEELAKYQRGSNIEKYPDGWQVGLGNDIFVVSGGTLRKIASNSLYKNLGYNSKYILRVFPEFLKRYPRGYDINGFKNVFAGTPTIKKVGPSPNAANNLIKVRPAIRTLISEINDIYLTIFDKEITSTDNKFWVNYVYSGEVSTKDSLVSAIKKSKTTGKKPPLTSRTQILPKDSLRDKWFPYLFYFVFQREPSSDDRNYWYSRIDSGDRNTIEKLGGTMQWLKDTAGISHK